MDSINHIVRKLREGKELRLLEAYKDMSDKDLVATIQDGDQRAFEYLIEKYQDFLYRMTKKYIMDTQDPDDIMQLAKIALWSATMSWNLEGDFEAYAGMIIKRKLTDELRKDSTGKSQIHTKASSLSEPTADDGEGGETSLGDMLPDKDLSPEEQYLGKEGARELLKFMRDRFSEREREVVMRHIKGAKISEIAEEMGMTYKSVENTIMRIKNKLNDYMKRPTRESRKIRESRDLDFSDEERQILESVLTKISGEKMTESVNYEEYTEDQLGEELDKIEHDIEEIAEQMKDTDYDDRDNLLNSLNDLEHKISAIEGYLTDEQYEKAQGLYKDIRRAEDTEYEGIPRQSDPYTERGLKRSDFY